MNIIKFVKTLRRRLEAKRYGIPFQEKMWYNYSAMLPKETLHEKSFIEIFGENGCYINCPGIGGEVIYNDRGKRYRYRVIGFDNDSPNKDWLYVDDWINPIVEYVGKIQEKLL